MGVRWGWGAAAALLLGSIAPVGSASALGRTDAVSDQRVVIALDPASGKELWHAAPDGQFGYEGSAVGPKLVLTRQAVCTRGPEQQPAGSGLVALDARTGDRQWSEKGSDSAAVQTMFWSNTPSVDVAAGGIVVTPGGRFGTAMNGLDAQTGKVRWKLGPEFHELGVSATLVFTASAPTAGSANVLVAHGRQSGRKVWTFPNSPDPAWGPTFDVVAANARTLVVGNGGYLSRFSSAGGPDKPSGPTTFFVLDATTGIERSRFTSDDPAFSFSDFAMVDGLLVYAERDYIVARQLDNGAVRWKTSVAFTAPTPPVQGLRPLLMRASADAQTVFGLSGREFVALDTRTGAERWRTADHFI